MDKYRRKPEIVDAVQWDPDSLIEKPEPGEPDKYGVIWRYDAEGNLANGFVKISEYGESYKEFDFRLIEIGDWILTKENGEKEVCGPDEFEANYEKIEN